MRQSFKYSNWTKTRGDSYKKNCDEILFRIKSKIVIEGDDVFVVNEIQKNYLLTIDNPKTAWFLIWLKLRDEK